MRLRLARGLEPKTQCGHLVDFEWRVRIVQQCVTGILDVFPDFFRYLMDRVAGIYGFRIHAFSFCTALRNYFLELSL